MRKIVSLALTLALLLTMAACSGTPAPASPAAPAEPASPSGSDPAPGEPGAEPVTILIAAAASLEYSFRDELIPMFQDKHPEITVEGTYDSSGKLQTQIEEGLEADLFFSAAMKQMNALDEKGLMDSGTVAKLLENKIVLITAAEGARRSFPLRTSAAPRASPWGTRKASLRDSTPRKPLPTWGCGTASSPGSASAPTSPRC